MNSLGKYKGVFLPSCNVCSQTQAMYCHGNRFCVCCRPFFACPSMSLCVYVLWNSSGVECSVLCSVVRTCVPTVGVNDMQLCLLRDRMIFFKIVDNDSKIIGLIN